MPATLRFPKLFRPLVWPGGRLLATRRPCGAGHPQARPGRRHVRPVRQVRRGHRARAVARDRRDQRQGRPARQEGRTSGPRRRKQSGQGRGRSARTRAAREGRGAVRRPRHAGVAGDRAVRQPGEGAVHGRLGGRHADHQERRRRELRVPRLGGRRDRRQGAGRLRDQEIRRQEARHDPDQQSVGRIERERPQGRARREEACPMPASRSSRPTTSTWCRNSPASSRPAPMCCSWSPTSRRPRRW